MKPFFMSRFLIFVFCLCALVVKGQSDSTIGSIITDRPDASNTSFLVPKGYIQIEVGAQLDGDKLAKDNCQLVYTYDNTSIKYSPSHFFELKLISGYCKQENNKKTYWDKSTDASKGVTPVLFGSKVLLLEQHKRMPHISLESNFILPFSKTFGSPSFICPEFRLLFFNQLTNRFSLSYNVGIDYFNSSKLASPRYLYTFSLGVSIQRRLAAFVESYGYFQPHTRADYRIDGGLTYHILNQLQADIAGGYGLSPVSPDFFITTGISWRFKIKD